LAKIAQIKLIFDKGAIEELKGKNLQDQVDAFVQAGATLYKKKADISKVAQKKEAIQKAIDRLNEGLWTLKTGPSEDNDTLQADVADEDSDEE
jgi:ribosomal protein L19E